MKSASVIALTFLLACTAASAQTLHIQSNGLFASGIGCGDPVCNPTISVSAFSLSSTTGPQSGGPWAISYDVYNVATSANLFGFGNVPASAVAFNGTSQVTLNIDTSTVPGFFNVSCSPTDPNGCSLVAGGLVDVVIQRVSYATTTSTFTNSVHLPNLVETFNGASDAASAIMTGTVLGYTILGGPPAGQIGLMHTTSITLQKQ